jgi:YVTN family beta-propeller protein
MTDSVFAAARACGALMRRGLNLTGLLFLSVPTWAAPPVYVLNSSAPTLTVIDAATDSVAAVVALPGVPNSLAVAGDGARVYVGSQAVQSVTVIDGSTRSVLASWPLSAAPAALAVSGDGSRLYALLAGGVLQSFDTTTGVMLASLNLGGGSGLAVSPDGATVFVAAGTLRVVQASTLTAVGSVSTGADHNITRVALSPDGSKAWVVHDIGIFSGGVSVIDTKSQGVIATSDVGSILGPIALAPDGSRAYVGLSATFINTGWAGAFFPGRSVLVFDTAANGLVGQIDLGAGGSNWTLQNTASGIAVTPDRRTVYVSVPRIAAVAAAGVNTHVVRTTIAVAGPSQVGAARSGETLVPYTVDAVDDNASSTTYGGVAVANVLANDRYGAIVPTLAHVDLVQTDSSSPAITLNGRSVLVAAGTGAGSYTLGYRICDRTDASNCDSATVTVTVTTPRTISAAGDSATTYPGTASVLNVRANDTLAGAAATSANTTLTLLSSSHAGVTLNTTSGVVSVATGVPLGAHTLGYRLCETAVAANCASATVTLTVIPRPIVAADDSAAAPRTGGRVLASVLANDRLAGAQATLANVSLALVSASHAGVTLNLGDASVNVAAGTAVGVHTLVYRICEIALPTNCGQATVTVTVGEYLIDAVNDSARASSKVAGVVLANVLANDRLGSGAATLANVTLSLVSLTPANPKIVLETNTGAIRLLGRTESGLYQLVYRICETASPGNCDSATASLDLSGR